MILHKKVPWKELLPGQQIIVLQWMIDGLNQAVESFIKLRSYNALIQSLHQGKKFIPEEIWNSLPVNTQSHFEHTKEILALLEKMIDDTTDKPMKKTVSLPAVEPEPMSKAEPPKKSKKKGKGGKR